MGDCCRELGALGNVARSAAPMVAAFYLGPAAGAMFGTSAAIGSAIVGAGVGGLSAGMQGKNILTGAIMGGIGGYVAGGGLGSPSDWLAKTGDTLNPSINAATKAAETAAEGMANQAGISAKASEFLTRNASSGTIGSGLPGAVASPTSIPGTGFPSSLTEGYTGQIGAATLPPTVTPPPPGLFSRAFNLAEKYPIGTMMTGQAIAAGIGAAANSEAQIEQAQLNRDAQLQMNTVQGGFENPRAVTVNDRNKIVNNAGMYLYGPLKGTFAPGRAPGLLNAARA